MQHKTQIIFLIMFIAGCFNLYYILDKKEAAYKNIQQVASEDTALPDNIAPSYKRETYQEYGENIIIARLYFSKDTSDDIVINMQNDLKDMPAVLLVDPVSWPVNAPGYKAAIRLVLIIDTKYLKEGEQIPLDIRNYLDNNVVSVKSNPGLVNWNFSDLRPVPSFDSKY